MGQAAGQGCFPAALAGRRRVPRHHGEDRLRGGRDLVHALPAQRRVPGPAGRVAPPVRVGGAADLAARRRLP